MGNNSWKNRYSSSAMISNICNCHREFKAMLVDMDDTIISDDSLTEKTWRDVCSRFAPLTGSLDAALLYSVIKGLSDEYWRDPDKHRTGRLDLAKTRRDIVSRALRKAGIQDDRLGHAIADAYTNGKEQAIDIIPRAIEALDHFKKAGLRLALITNGSSEVQRRKIERFKLDTIFDFILVEAEFGQGKPHAAIFKAALDKLEVTAGETCMVGDDLERDIAGAQALGIFSIWVDWRKKGLHAASSISPDCIIGSIAELAR
jgi:putative hydrolase of the HAD superfamily